jgi:L-ribulose-5-phosphate 3-epimerase UlaE
MENSDFSHNSDKKQQDWVNFRIGHPVQFDPFADADGYFLDVDEGQKAVDFFPSCLCHIKGQKALTPFDLELWQKSIIGHSVWMEVGEDRPSAIPRSLHFHP